MSLNFLRTKNIVYIFISLIIIIYIILKAYYDGNDINVYLFASNQLFNGENIYADNPFNKYLYSPLFALLLRPLSILNFSIARIIWAAINLILTFRLWAITYRIIVDSLVIDKKFITWWTIGVITISLGFLNHNLILGQITIMILWLTFEGLYQIVVHEKPVKGALLLALGINIKIIPLIGIFYLFFKGKYKTMVICTGMVILSLLLPSLIIGHDYNMRMLRNWKETINPAGNKYVFENNTGTQSLNAIIPAFFYNFNDGIEAPVNLKRQITAVSYDTLVIIMQIFRILLLSSSLILIFYKSKQREKEPIYFFWEFSYLALVSALIFPHQQKYAMLYFVPAGSYMILFIFSAFKLKWDIELKYRVIALLSSLLMFISTIGGRDIIGNYLTNLLNYYKISGLTNIAFLGFLILIKPDLLINMNYEKLSKST